MKNADKFKGIFGIYATELWAKTEKEFLEWLNDYVPDTNVGDMISRQAAIDALMARDKELRNINWYDKPYAESECRRIDEALLIISNLPSAQPERKKGKWFFSDTDFLTHCSNCGQSEWKGYCPTPEEATEWMPICPKCGADMRKETEDA